MKLGVNVDHVATLREARGTHYPDPVEAALLCKQAGCDSIVVHLREDSRHIKMRDVILIKQTVNLPLNLEMSINKDIVAFALRIKPHQTTLVPERREELTTEGGIDLLKDYKRVNESVKKLKGKRIKVSLFIDPKKEQIKTAKRIGADLIEINTGRFSEAKLSEKKKELDKIRKAAKFAKKEGFFVAAGHGLNYENVKDIVKIKEIEELNIGHSIICRAVFMGIVSATRQMLSIIRNSNIKYQKSK